MRALELGDFEGLPHTRSNFEGPVLVLALALVRLVMMELERRDFEVLGLVHLVGVRPLAH